MQTGNNFHFGYCYRISKRCRSRADVLKKEAGIYSFGRISRTSTLIVGIDRNLILFYSVIDNTQNRIQLKRENKDLRGIGEGRSKRFTALFYDNDGAIELVWFSRIKWFAKSLTTETYVLFGKPSWF